MTDDEIYEFLGAHGAYYGRGKRGRAVKDAVVDAMKQAQTQLETMALQRANEEESLQSLANELKASYELLREALPLARQTLIRGVSLQQQSNFWEAYRELSEFTDLEEEHIHSPRGINGRIDEL